MKLLPLFFALLPAGFLVGQASRGVEIALADSPPVRSAAARLDLGLLLHGDKKLTEIVVRNISNRPVAVDVFSFQDNAEIKWKEADFETGLWTHRTLSPGESLSAEITILADGSKLVPQLSLASEGNEMTHIAVEYVEVAEPMILYKQRSPTLISGLGEWWSDWYSFCSGHAPPGYTVQAPSSFQVEQFPSGEPHPRSCGAYVQCRLTEQDDQNVCYQAAVQGHHHGMDFLHNREDEPVYFFATLQVTYRFNPSKPKLTAVELKKENAAANH
jgi:hypothetical protein